VLRAAAIGLAAAVFAGLAGAAAPPRGSIAFSRAGDLFTIPAAGGKERRLTSGRFLDLDPSWSPDGRRVAFTRCCADGASRIMLLTVATGHTEPLRGSVEGCQPDWSPRGDRIAYAICEGETGVQVRVSTLAGRVLARWPGETPTWSPDGQRVAYAAPGASGSSLIFVRPAGGPARRVTRNVDSDDYSRQPAWAPSGDRIAFSGNRRTTNPAILYVVNAATGKVRQVRPLGSVNTEPTWAADGRFLAFACIEQIRAQLCVTPAAGGRDRRLTSGRADVGGPDWSP